MPRILRGGDAELENPNEPEAVEKRELLEIGCRLASRPVLLIIVVYKTCRCYVRGIDIRPEAAHLWHDLALGYFHLANVRQCRPESELVN